MADKTKIEWADATVNAVNGCSVLSPGCTNCYAMKLAGTRLKHVPSRAGLTQDSKAGPVWTGEVRLDEKQLLQPLRWKRPRRIFWNAHGDLFHDAVPNEWIDRVFAVCALTPQHTHMILTKRAGRMREYLSDPEVARQVWDVASENDRILSALAGQGASWGGAAPWPLPNVWLGVSVEDQARADERLPDLLATPAAVRFISAEPLLGPIDLTGLDGPGDPASHNVLAGRSIVTDCNGDEHLIETPTIDWVIVGGESGPGARPMHPDWARSLRDQCQAAGVAFHFKQWGEWVFEDQLYSDPGDDLFDANGDARKDRSHLWPEGEWMSFKVGKKRAGRLLDGREWNEVPA